MRTLKDKLIIFTMSAGMFLFIVFLTSAMDIRTQKLNEQAEYIEYLQKSIDDGYKNGLHKYNLKYGLAWPVHNILSATVTSRIYSYRPYGKWKLHFSTDIFQKNPAYVLSMCGGVVTNIQYHKYWGWRTTITGNRYKIIYSHTDKPIVEVNFIIGPGKSFAKIGKTGRWAKYEAAHLCFQVYEWIGGRWVLIDPIAGRKKKAEWWGDVK